MTRHLDRSLLIALIATTAILVLPSSEFFKNHLLILPKSIAFAFIGGAIAWRLSIRKRPIPFTAIEIGGIAAIVVAALTAIANGTHPLLWIPWSAEAALWLAIFLFARDHFSRESDLLVVESILWIGTAVALSAFLEALAGDLPWTVVEKPGGLLGNRNSVATYAGFAMAIGAFLYLRRPLKKYLPAIALCAAVVGISRTRAVWLSLGLVVIATVMLLSFLLSKRMKWRGPAMTLALVIFATLVLVLNANFRGLPWRESNPYASSLARLTDYRGGTGRDRHAQLQLAKKIAAETPWTGGGPGAWRKEGPRFEYEIMREMGNIVDVARLPSPASDLTRWLAEFGITGALMLALMIFVALQTLRELYKQKGKNLILDYGAFTALAFLFLNAVFDKPFYRLHTACLGIVTAAFFFRHRTPVGTLAAKKQRCFAIGIPAVLAAAVILQQAASRYRIFHKPDWKSIKSIARVAPDPYALGLLLKLSVMTPAECDDLIPSLERTLKILPNEYGLHQYLATCFKDSNPEKAKYHDTRRAELIRE